MPFKTIWTLLEKQQTWQVNLSPKKINHKVLQQNRKLKPDLRASWDKPREKSTWWQGWLKVTVIKLASSHCSISRLITSLSALNFLENRRKSKYLAWYWTNVGNFIIDSYRWKNIREYRTYRTQKLQMGISEAVSEITRVKSEEVNSEDLKSSWPRPEVFTKQVNKGHCTKAD